MGWRARSPEWGAGMSAAAAYKPAHGGYPGTVQAGAVRDTGKRKAAAELHEILCKIASEVASGGPGDDVGLCALVEYGTDAEGFERMQPLLREAIEAWPEYYGCVEYPIADPTGRYTPAMAYAILRKWGDTPYGRARRRLLWHCIDWCEAAMAE